MIKRTPEPERMAYSVKEVCELADIGRKLFYKLVKEGKLHTIKAGRRRLIPADSLMRWLGGGLPMFLPIPVTALPGNNEKRRGTKKTPKDTQFRA